MSDIGVAELTGAASITIEIKGKPYKCISPTLRDWGELIDEIRGDMRKEAKTIGRSLKEIGIGDEIVTREYLRLYDRAASLQRVQIQAALIRHTLKGVRHYFLACAHSAHPELTKAEVERIIDDNNYRDVDRELSPLFPEEKKAEEKAKAKAGESKEGDEKKAEGAGPSTASPQSAGQSAEPTESAPGKSAA